MSLDVYLIEDSGEHPGSGIYIREEVYEANITHNLDEMAQAAGIYECVWRPREHGFVFAKDIVPTLKQGIDRLRESPDTFKVFDAENGWGTYEQFVPWLEHYLAACEQHPMAEIRVSR